MTPAEIILCVLIGNAVYSIIIGTLNIINKGGSPPPARS